MFFVAGICPWSSVSRGNMFKLHTANKHDASYAKSALVLARSEPKFTGFSLSKFYLVRLEINWLISLILQDILQLVLHVCHSLRAQFGIHPEFVKNTVLS